MSTQNRPLQLLTAAILPTTQLLAPAAVAQAGKPNMPKHRKFSVALVVCLVSLLGYEGASHADDSSVTAIDIALEPDATMMQHAEAANARLREVYPKGYTLDASHQPHITMLQRFVKTSDLDKVYAAVGNVLPGEKPAGWTLEAYKYDGAVWNGEGLTVILVKPTPDLIAFQQKLIDAVAPFTVETGTAAAFFTTPEEPNINQPTIDYVKQYVPASSGTNLMPHVTVGVVPPDYMKKLIAEPFDTFTFAPSAMSVYQLGNFGTARKKLEAWEFRP